MLDNARRLIRLTTLQFDIQNHQGLQRQTMTGARSLTSEQRQTMSEERRGISIEFGSVIATVREFLAEQTQAGINPIIRHEYEQAIIEMEELRHRFEHISILFDVEDLRIRFEAMRFDDDL
jgi:hypothetical protein